MRIALLGVRGSTPAPGFDFAGFGGHTSCVAVYGDGDAVPRLVLDAGTGLRSLPALMNGAPFVGDIVLSHLHWDHVQGLPFCPSIDRPDARVILHVPVADPGTDATELLARSMSPPHFPIGPDGLIGLWRIDGLLPGRLELAGGSIVMAPVEHKGGTTYGIRVELDGVSLAYVPDHLLTGELGPASDEVAELIGGADLLLHDGQYLTTEVAVARDYAHATIDAVLALADRCEVGRLMLTHHSPGRTDSQLQKLADWHVRTPGGIEVRFARQDAVVTVTGS